jgi:hypothetical protein
MTSIQREGDSNVGHLQRLAVAFRVAIETTRAERLPGALPYFPEGACRMTSRLLAQYLAQRPETFAHGRVEIVSGVLSDSNPPARHYWLEIGETVVDLTADAFGQPAVIVGAKTAFHSGLQAVTPEDAGESVAALTPVEAARLGRQLAVIESRMVASD